MELAQIKYFLALCETQNFTKAAERSGISQPSLSNAIKALEDELGGTLVQRAPFALTSAGKAIRPHFRTVLRHIARAKSVGAGQRDPRRGPARDAGLTGEETPVLLT